MVLRLDAGQANYFDLAEAAPREHPSYVLATDAARRAAEKPVRSSEKKIPASVDGSIDALNQHLRKIEELRRKLEREDSLVLELAPAVDIPQEVTPVDPVPANLQLQQRRRIAMSAAAVAAAAALSIAGLFYFLRPSTLRHAEPAPTEARKARTPSDARARLVHLVTRLSLGTRKMELQPALNRVCSKQGQNHDWKLGR